MVQQRMPRKNVREELLDLLACNMCSRQMRPPIYSCTGGHIACNPCISQTQTCSICTCQFTGVRNSTIEALAEKVDYPCSYKDLGCPKEFLLKDIKEHETFCDFKPYKCPLNIVTPCPWSNPLFLMKDHIESSHKDKMKVVKFTYLNSLFDYNLVQDGKNKSWQDILVYDGRIFFWYSFFEQEYFYSCVLLVGKKQDERKYCYSLTFKRHNSVSSITMAHPVYNYEDDFLDIVKHLKCARFNSEFILSCFYPNGTRTDAEMLLEIY